MAPVTPIPLTDKTIVVTGATGQVGFPVAVQLAAAGNEVWAPARFSNPKAKAKLEEAGVRTVVSDLGTVAGMDDLPAAADFVANFAVAKTGDPDEDLRSNAESVGQLMDRFRDCTAFLHLSLIHI